MMTLILNHLGSLEAFIDNFEIETRLDETIRDNMKVAWETSAAKIILQDPIDNIANALVDQALFLRY